MAKTRNILVSVKTDTAIGERSCDMNSKHVIKPGEKHLVYIKNGYPVNICSECAKLAFPIAQTHLTELKKELGI